MTVPVPLTDIEALAKGIRIAVEALERMNPDGPDDCLRVGEYEVACAEVADAQDWCDACVRLNALAAVRELVDLGGDDE